MQHRRRCLRFAPGWLARGRAKIRFSQGVPDRNRFVDRWHLGRAPAPARGSAGKNPRYAGRERRHPPRYFLGPHQDRTSSGFRTVLGTHYQLSESIVASGYAVPPLVASSVR